MNTYKVVKKDYNWQQLVLGKMQLNINAKRSMSFLSGAQNFGAARYVQSLKKKKKKKKKVG